MNLTPEQQEAAGAHGRDVCVSAGAGSGKTAVLVHRFLDELFNHGARMSEILAITFTKKAAGEMKMRIAAELRARGRMSELKELENAYISTIDSFCARLLRENPVEGGVDPNFMVVVENDVQVVIERILNDVTEERCQEASFREFIFRYTIDAVHKAVRSAYDRIRSRGRDMNDSFERDLGQVRKNAKEALGRAIAAVLVCEEGANQKKPKPMFENVKTFRDALGALERKGACSWDDIGAFRDMTRDGLIPLPRSASDGALREAVEIFREEKEKFLSVLAEEQGEPARQALAQLTQDFSDRYDAWKRERLVLDFNDLLLKAYRMLAHPAFGVRRAYQEKFRLIMVDEYQDTGVLQDRMVDLLSRGRNVFLVGDEKQAIYGFRDADTELFRKRKEAFSKSGSEKGVLALDRNFRSRKTLLGFVNDFFREIWREEEKEAEFSPLIPDESIDKKFPPVDNEKSCVEWIISTAASAAKDREGVASEADSDNGKEAIQISRFREAKLLAIRIRGLVEEEKRPIYDKSEGKIRPCRYGDVAVLFRARTALTIFERAFREADIPYFVVSGYGFYHQPEIRDVISFLTVLENPTYDIPLAGILRSPFVGCSDEALLWLGRHAKKKNRETPLFFAVDQYKRIAELSVDDSERIGHFLARFERLREEKHRTTISNFLHRLVRENRYDIKILGERYGKRKMANLMKLVDLAQGFEEKENLILGDFIRHLRELEVRAVDEPEAQVEAESDNVLKLMTIHQAKGLEFPVVVIADLGYADVSRDTSLIVIGRDGDVGVKVKNPKTGLLERTYSFNEIARAGSERDAGESKRLFYVAATRARELLIFSGSSKWNRLGDKLFREIPVWFDWIRKVLGCDEPSFSGDGGRIKLKEHSVSIIRQDRTIFSPLFMRRTCLAAKGSVRRLFESGTVGSPEATRASEEARAIVNQTVFVRRPFFETVDVSATSLLLYEKCPQLFYSRYVLRVPEKAPRRNSYEEQPDDEERTLLARTDLGTIVHALLEKTEFGPRFSYDIHRQTDLLAGVLDGESLRRLENMLKRFAEAPFFKELQSARSTAKEFDFSLRMKRGMVRGFIDLVYETEGGEWVLVDYKTTGLAKEEWERTAETYRSQILLYALAWEKLARKAPREAKLFFMNEEESRAVSVPLSAEILKDAERKFEKMLEDIAVGLFLPRGQHLCAYCTTEDFCRKMLSGGKIDEQRRPCHAREA